MYENCDKHEPSTRTKYGYDEFNRLSTRTTTGTVLNYSYTYDRWGNRTAQTITAGGSGPQTSVLVNDSTNQISSSGFSYDAAGNMTNDSSHSYTFDADGNITAVDGGSTASYVYNTLNQRVRSIVGSTTTEYVFNINGRRVSEWNGSTRAQLKGKYYWGSRPIAFYSGGSCHFEHQDWMDTARVRTSYSGSVEGTYSSLPFGDGQSSTGVDNDSNHFAALDYDSESSTNHAQYRQYSNAQGRWSSPDPYAGSYDPNSPQSYNRYTYNLNGPLAFVDDTGLCGGLIAGITADPTKGGGQRLLQSAMDLGYDVAFPYAGQNHIQGIFSVAAQQLGKYNSASATAAALINDVYQQTSTTGGGSLIGGWSGGAAAMQSSGALTSNTAQLYLSPGGAQIPENSATSLTFAGSGVKDTIVNALNSGSSLYSGSPGCGHDGACEMDEHSDEIQNFAAQNNVQPCPEPKAILPLNFDLTPQFLADFNCYESGGNMICVHQRGDDED